ncbi:DUF6046 domain-containing protein [Flavobacterium praedii]|uniref:DUF6046 domain-containing protein n=1 Tax=Flavobacterium praedii TaxID=3002900 RepID=UPI002481A7F2|nr:DUF6046 domain-containing protein [Flavobacterium praedii]
MLDNQDILFASLMGSRAVTLIQNANVVNNELAKHVLPVIPFLPLKNNTNVAVERGRAINVNDNWTTPNAIDQQKQFFPLSFSFKEKGVRWVFPYEPMINISSGNNIVKRNVAKQGENLIGTIKERWSRKDFDITVTGVLIGSIMQGKPEDCFPKDQFVQLFNFLKHSKELYVYSHPLELLGITKVVIEDYSFPFTKGENVQAYELKLVSDFSYDLLIKEKV